MAKLKKKPQRKFDIAEGWRRFERLPSDVLAAWRNLLMLAVVADLFLVIFFLKQMQIGIFIFLLILIMLIMVLIAERRQDVKMENKLLGDEKPAEETTEEKTDENPPVEDDPTQNAIPQVDLGVEGIEREFDGVADDLRKSVEGIRSEKSVI